LFLQEYWIMSEDRLSLILGLDKASLLRHLSVVGVEHCDAGGECACDVEDLQGLLYSFCCTVPDYERLYELCEFFHESFQLVQTLVECNGGITNQVVEQLCEQCATVNPDKLVTVACKSLKEFVADVPSELNSDVAIIAVELGTDTEVTGCVSPIRSMQLVTLTTAERITSTCRKVVLAPPLLYGLHRVAFGLEDGGHIVSASQQVTVTTPVSRYVAALEALYDRMYWGWEGQWTEELERTLLELVVTVDEDLVGVVNTLTRMMNMMQGVGSAGAKEMQHMLECVFTDVQRALTDHSTYAVGRLHQTLLQFVEMQETMGAIVRVPQTSIIAIEAFVAAKLAASMDAGMQTALLNLVRQLYALSTHG
jgi:hypothetical protein